MEKIEFNEQNFENEVLNFDGITLVDFWAPWCGPCQQLGPIVEELAKNETRENVKIGKLNIDENPDIASKYGIMSIPTILIFKNKEVVEQLVGVQSLDSLKEKIEENL